MSLTDRFVSQLEALKEGDRARLRQLAGQPLDKTVRGFDLFTGLWWPLRKESPKVPERRTAWLVAKLFGAFPLPHIRDPGATLPSVLGRAEQRQREPKRFRLRFHALLLAPLARLETHLRWALSVARHAVAQGHEPGIDWVRLLDDLPLWDRGEDVRDQWAESYLSHIRRKGNDDAH